MNKKFIKERTTLRIKPNVFEKANKKVINKRKNMLIRNYYPIRYLGGGGVRMNKDGKTKLLI